MSLPIAHMQTRASARYSVGTPELLGNMCIPRCSTGDPHTHTHTRPSLAHRRQGPLLGPLSSSTHPDRPNPPRPPPSFDSTSSLVHLQGTLHAPPDTRAIYLAQCRSQGSLSTSPFTLSAPCTVPGPPHLPLPCQSSGQPTWSNPTHMTP